MRIPPLYRLPSWQRFLAGMAIGGIISWFLFIYLYGAWQEDQAKLIHKQKDVIRELNNEISIWQEEYKTLNKRNKEQLTVQEIKVKVMNGDKYKLDLYSVFEIEEGVKQDISLMVAKDLDMVFKSRDLLKKIIENKRIKVNDRRYKLEVKEILIYTTLSIQLEIHLDG